jgi:hypothetical protein
LYAHYGVCLGKHFYSRKDPISLYEVIKNIGSNVFEKFAGILFCEPVKAVSEDSLKKEQAHFCFSSQIMFPYWYKREFVTSNLSDTYIQMSWNFFDFERKGGIFF